jgi:hypothetical protein
MVEKAPVPRGAGTAPQIPDPPTPARPKPVAVVLADAVQKGLFSAAVIPPGALVAALFRAPVGPWVIACCALTTLLLAALGVIARLLLNDMDPGGRDV